jgi:hypothetical protein
MSDLIPPTTGRRKFLGGIAATAAAVGLSGALPSRLAAEITSGPGSPDPALDAWFARIKGQHRMIFDAPEPNSGSTSTPCKPPSRVRLPQ